MSTSEPVLLRRAGKPLDIASYRADGGYSIIEKAYHELQPAQITDMVKASGLRGRGGAASRRHQVGLLAQGPSWPRSISASTLTRANLHVQQSLSP